MKPKLRSQEWFGQKGKAGFISRSWMKNQGYLDDIFDGRPVIGICNTWSDLTPCNAHLRDLAERVKHGILEAGGVPLEFPAMSLGEALMKPTTMLYRNLASMGVEESLRANPLDGVVLLVNCDKTTPSSIMGAASVDLPTIVVSGGPMLNGKYQGKDIGSGTDLWKFSEDLRSGKLTQEEFNQVENGMSRSSGACNTMGTASSMSCMVEALGLTLPNAAAIPAVDANRRRVSQLAGRRIVDMVHEDLTLSKILTRKAFENAIITNAAIGGSTNFILHLQAISGRLDIKLDLSDFDRLSQNIPLLANLKPSGDYLMEDFYYAGGLASIISNLRDKLHTQVIHANGHSLQDNYSNAPCYNSDVIATLDKPFQENAGTVVVKGNLAADGAIIKPSAASPELMKVKQKCYVFENIEDYNKNINDPELPVTEDTILVLKDAGVRGYPAMPEVGNFGLPKKMLEKGVRDMVRISDGRMSGTAYGTIILHVSPESHVGGPLAFVETGDEIELDVYARVLNLCISDIELKRRKDLWVQPESKATRGYTKLYIDSVQQAHLGADFDFLVGGSGKNNDREPHPE
jgi:dihydroxy-acid dehydratase